MAIEASRLEDDDSGRTYTLWVIVVDTATHRPVDLYPAEVADMDNLAQAQLAAKAMAGLL